jgi:hypothetical protein
VFKTDKKKQKLLQDFINSSDNINKLSSPTSLMSDQVKSNKLEKLSEDITVNSSSLKM